MIDQAKINISFIVTIIFAVISTQISIDDLIDKTKYESPIVPVFNLPTEISTFKSSVKTHFPEVKVNVLLGEPPVVETKIIPLRKPKPKVRLRRLRVKAIMIQGKDRIANINGRILKVGSYIHGRTVIKIEKKRVLLTGPKGKETLLIKD